MQIANVVTLYLMNDLEFSLRLYLFDIHCQQDAQASPQVALASCCNPSRALRPSILRWPVGGRFFSSFLPSLNYARAHTHTHTLLHAVA